MTAGRRALLAMSGTALAGLAAAAALLHFHESSKVSPTQPLPPMHTVCVGRLLIDVPSDMEPEGDVELYYGLGNDFQTAKLELVSVTAAKAEFESALGRRLADLTKDQDDSTPSKNMLAATRRLDEQTAFVLAHAEPVMHGYFLAEVLLLRGRSIGRLTRKVYNTEQPKNIEAELVELARRTVPFDDASRATKGTCLGPLLLEGGQDGEVFTVSLRSSRHPELSMQIMTNSIIAESDGGLLHRVDAKASLLASLGATGHTLRRGNAQVAGRPAQELIESAKDHDKTIRQFDVETSLVKPSSIAEPQVHIDMSMGGQLPSGDYVEPSLSESASVQLWDAVVKSVRVRPGSI